MQKLDLVLAHLRVTLLAACGVSVSACTGGPSKPSEPETEPPPDKVFTEQEPDRKQNAGAPLCPDPTPILGSNGQPTGYIRCADGAINRQSSFGCDVPITAPACKGTEDSRDCDTAANCTAGAHGFCMSDWGQMGTFCTCVYPCVNDGECGTGQTCMCPGVKENGPSVATCVESDCKVNDDCASGECGASIHFNGCGHELGLHCRTSDDACRSDDRCEYGSCAAAVGRTDPLIFQCESTSCAIGRPLTVEEGVRVASVDARRWGATQCPDLATALDRAEYWLGIARMEHASVASFARFVHELLRFDAPPQLIADATAAAADEVRHAEQTFAIASAYAGAPLGPGGLRIDDLSPTDDPELFVTRLITEGCVGETLGVAEALALLSGDLDPSLRPQLEQIAADETRHAALAWRALAWFAPRVDARVIERAFERALEQAERVDDELPDPRHGRLGRDVKCKIRQLAIASVIQPCRQSSNRDHSSIISTATQHPQA